MRFFILAALIAVFTPTLAAACAKPSGAASLEAGMIQWINQQRQANGLSPLRQSSKLTSAAQSHACDMAGRNFFAHQRAGGPKLGDRAKANGYRFRHIAENIAFTRTPSVAQAAGMWRKSPPHWAAILKPEVKEIGLAVASGSGNIYWVMNVGAQL
ncbi:MAG: CAP domain-containing protein [Paracoccaceae bacterium]